MAINGYATEETMAVDVVEPEPSTQLHQLLQDWEKRVARLMQDAEVASQVAQLARQRANEASAIYEALSIAGKKLSADRQTSDPGLVPPPPVMGGPSRGY